MKSSRFRNLCIPALGFFLAGMAQAGGLGHRVPPRENFDPAEARQINADLKKIRSFPKDAWIAYFDNVDEAVSTQSKQVSDPIEAINRVTFYVNDKLYRWIITPTGAVYGFILPVFVRDGVKHVAYNVAMPVRLTNNLFQGNIKGAWHEMLRFLVNTTVGIGGIFDPATAMNIKPSDQDTGKTFGKYGFGNGFYMVIPLVGPSTARDGVGKIFDMILNPLSYGPQAVSVFVKYNDAVMTVAEYEKQTGNFFDPYTRLRDYYILMRKSSLRE